jgi:alkylhydroperoxidase/carboxymuconolactone decarboxylase family protein YurZ
MMGKPDLLDRLAQLLLGLAALFALANGAFMLADPSGWYDFVGTVKATGPENRHFIRDIGIAYLISGGLVSYAAFNPFMRWGSALAGTGWLALHGALHIWEVSTGICAPGIFWQDAPGVLGPPALALVAILIMLVRIRVATGPLPKRLFLQAAGRMTGGLSPHLPDIAAAPGFLAEKFQHFMPLSLHRHAASAEQVDMARIGAVMAEDCGPCCLIAAQGALRNGMDRAAANAALAGNPAEGPGREAYEFAQAIARNAPDVNELGDAIEAQYGRAVRTELTFAAALARTHPAFKRGLGFARSCSAVPLEV